MTIFVWVGSSALLALILLVLGVLVWTHRDLPVTLDSMAAGTIALTLVAVALAAIGLSVMAKPLAFFPVVSAEGLAATGTLIAVCAAMTAFPYYVRAIRAARVASAQIPQSLYADAIRHAPVALIVLDEHGRVRYAEGGALLSAGWLQPSSLGQSVSTALPPTAARAFHEVWLGAMEGRTERRRVYTVSDEEGGARWYALTGAPTKVNGTRAVVLAVELDGAAEAAARVQAHLTSVANALS